MAKRERKIQLAIENFLSQRTQKLRRWLLLCFSNFLVSKTFMDKRVERAGERGSITFSLKNFCLSAEKLLEVAVWCFSSFRYMENLCLRGYVWIFCRKFFVSQYRKTSLVSTSVFQKNSGVKNIYGQERGRGRRCYQNFLSKTFVSLPKKFVAEPFSVPLISGNETCLG